MRWRYAGIGIVVIVTMTGCPHDYGMNGRADKEAHKAELELIRKYCDDKTREEFCGGGRQNTPECIEKCG